MDDKNHASASNYQHIYLIYNQFCDFGSFTLIFSMLLMTLFNHASLSYACLQQPQQDASNCGPNQINHPQDGDGVVCVRRD